MTALKTFKLPRISLCMIARNEAHVIEQAIKSVSSIIHEVIVVDTGSTDDTPHVVEKLGGIVLHRPWDDDFSAPRNFSLARATGDWILVLDADEAIAAKDLNLLVGQTTQRNSCFEMKQRHYSDDHRLSDYQLVSGEYPEWERAYLGYFASGLVRFFPNHCGIHYQGRVHELVEHSIRSLGKLSVINSPVPIHHYGHTKEELARKNKHSLYGALGETKLKDNPTDWKGFYELGVELNRPERREESAAAFKESIARKADYIPTWTNLGYVLCELGRLDEARQALTNALRLDPESSEALCNLGVVFMRAKDFANAERCLKAAVRSSPTYVNAYLNLSNTLVSLRRLSEAAFYLYKVVELAPRHARARADLGALYLLAGETALATEQITTALSMDPELVEAQQNLELISKTAV